MAKAFSYSICVVTLSLIALTAAVRADDMNRLPDGKSTDDWQRGIARALTPAEGQRTDASGQQMREARDDRRSPSRKRGRSAVRSATYQEPMAEEALPEPMAEEYSPEPMMEDGYFEEGYFGEFGYGPDACCSCEPCAPACNNYTPRWFGRAEYLFWWTEGMGVPDLVTTGSATDTLPGALGEPGTQVLFGGSELNDHGRSGGQFTLGRWLCPCQSSGVEVGYLVLADEDSGFRTSTNEFGVLARPFFNTLTAAEDARLIGLPGVLSGAVDVSSSTDFQTLGVIYRRAFARSDCARLDFIVGYRFAEQEDSLRINESSLALSGVLAGATFDLFDQFETRNTFNGAELGLLIERQTSPAWSWDIFAKLAIGGTKHRAVVNGQTIVDDGMGSATVTQAGLLTQGTNIGTYEWDDFSTLSQFGVTLRHHLRNGVSASFGYTFLYWSNVARAGDQIDTTVNPTQIPPGTLMGDARPAFPFRTTNLWAQGLRFGLEYSF